MLPNDYASVLKELKERIQSERLRVTLAANSALVLLYWDIGKILTVTFLGEQADWISKAEVSKARNQQLMFMDPLSYDLQMLSSEQINLLISIT